MTGTAPELYQASGLTLTIRALLNWPSSGNIRKTGPGTLVFEDSIYSTGDGGTPASTSFQIEEGIVQIESDNNNWLGGTTTANLIVGTGSTSATLQLLSADQLRNRTVIELASGQFQMLGNNETLRGLTGGGNVVGDGATLTLSPEGGGYSLDGSISDGTGATGLTVTGSGSQTLAGSQAYSGTTLIDGGAHLMVGGCRIRRPRSSMAA